MKHLYNNIINAIQESLNESMFNDPSDDILDSTDDENILADKITYGFEHHYNELKILFQKDGSLFHDVIIKVLYWLYFSLCGSYKRRFKRYNQTS